MTKKEEKLEQAGKRLHLLLYGGERENDVQYVEWRSRLEEATNDLLDAAKEQYLESVVQEEMKKWVGQNMVVGSREVLTALNFILTGEGTCFDGEYPLPEEYPIPKEKKRGH